MNTPATPNDYTAYPDADGPLRRLRRPLRARDPDAAGARAGRAPTRAAKADPAFQAELDGYLTHYVGRPSPLYFAERLTAHFGGAKIYLKREELNHTGAHKINNCIGQILLAMRMGKTRIIAETGAGQHGVATATVCARFGLPCVVYMGAVDVERQAPNVFRMKLLGAEVRPVTSRLGDAEGRHERGAARLGHQRRRHLLPDRLGGRPAPLSGDGARLPGGDRPRGARADAGGRGPAARRGGRLRRRRLQRHRHVPPVPQRRGRAALSASRRPATAWTPASTPRRSTAAGPACCTATRPTCCRTTTARSLEAHSISAGLDYPGVGPEHAWLHDVGRATYLTATDDEALEAFQLLRASWRASSRRWKSPTRWPASDDVAARGRQGRRSSC